jgi:hypothetical protein
MTMPIFKLPNIKHSNAKARKDFILDLIFIQVGGSLLHIGLTENFPKESEVKQLHKNKNRKEYKKVKELHDELQNEAKRIRERLTEKDRQTAYHKTSLLNSTFIRKVGLTNKSLNLEFLGICILDEGLNRKNRKSKRYEILDKFCDYKVLYNQIGRIIEKAGIEMTDEYEVAKDFISDVKY